MPEESVIRPIKRKENISNLVARQLIELIVSGKFAPGDKLPTEKELSELFGVGRNTLREAIRALSILGFVEVSVPEGMFVTQSVDNFYTRKMQLTSKYGYDNVTELTEARLTIECGITRLAAVKADIKDKENLTAVFLRMEQAGNDNEWREADAQFHMTVAEISGNAFLKQTLLLLIDGIYEWIRRVQSSAPTALDLYLRQHKVILEAICGNDPDVAEQGMKEHMLCVGEVFLKSEEGGQ